MAAHLEARYPELQGAVLVIHTKNNGDISEASSGKNKVELDKLRELSKTIDHWDNPHKAVVSVMVLREGWDVQNVPTIVGLRPLHQRAAGSCPSRRWGADCAACFAVSRRSFRWSETGDRRVH